MKKLLLTTAMATSLLATASFSAVTVGGGMEATLAGTQSGSTTAASVGNAIGFEYELDINATGELSNGMKISTHAEFISDGHSSGTYNAPNDIGMTIGLNDTTSIIIGQDQWEVMDQNVVPKAYNIIQDAANATTYDTLGNSAFAANSNNIGIAHKAMGGTIGFIYAPATSNNATNSSDRATTSGGGSAYELGYNGSLGVKGLSVVLGISSKKADTDTGTGETDGLVYGAAYQMGAVKVGFTVDDTNAPGTTTSDLKGTSFGITYAVSDAVTVGLQRLTTDIGGVATDEETDQIEVAYNLGAATLAANMQTTKNKGGSSSNVDLDSYTITLKHSF